MLIFEPVTVARGIRLKSLRPSQFGGNGLRGRGVCGSASPEPCEWVGLHGEGRALLLQEVGKRMFH